MEHIGDILKRKLTQTNTLRANTDTWSGAEESAEVSPPSSCPVCQGAGFVHPRLPSGNPDYSRVIACRCARDKLAAGRQKNPVSRFTFDNLNPQGESPSPISQEQFNRAYQAARAFAVEPSGWLILVGPSGCGKTHLAAAIANQRLNQGHPVLFITTPDLLDHLRSTFSPDSKVSYDQLFESVKNTPLLILDDFGEQSATPWAQEKLYQVINYRYSSELPTVIITITPVEQLEERIRSRLTDSKLCQICVVAGQQPSSLEYGWGPEFKLQKRMTFDTFDLKRALRLPEEEEQNPGKAKQKREEIRQNLEGAYRLTFEFAEAPEGWLILQGTYGCGKTHLAAAIVNYRYQAKQPALFLVVPEFLDHLRSTFSPESKISYDQFFESVKNTPLLILDDFGEQSTTPWAQEKLYQVINYRYNARLATVITTSFSLEEIEDRVSSRLVDQKISVLFNITAPDYRSEQRASRGTRKTHRRGKKAGWDYET